MKRKIDWVKVRIALALAALIIIPAVVQAFVIERLGR